MITGQQLFQMVSMQGNYQKHFHQSKGQIKNIQMLSYYIFFISGRRNLSFSKPSNLYYFSGVFGLLKLTYQCSFPQILCQLREKSQIISHLQEYKSRTRNKIKQ